MRVCAQHLLGLLWDLKVVLTCFLSDPACNGRVAECAAGACAGAGAKKETVVLPMVDSQGKAVPGAFGREKAGATAEPGGLLAQVAGNRFGSVIGRALLGGRRRARRRSQVGCWL